jgi:phosphatidylinositol dimannoside acyltransferase
VSGWSRRFGAYGVFWRRLARFGALSVPVWTEPVIAGFFALFFLCWGPGRRGVMRNLAAIKPGSTAIANFFRTYRVFWNYAWVLTDTVRFKERRTIPDWDFSGIEYFNELSSGDSGAIMITAHMGSYDLGAQLFSEVCARRIHMVRAPEADDQTHAFEMRQTERTGAETLRVEFNTKAGQLALELLDVLRRGEIVAIQADRITAGLSRHPTTMFGKPVSLPAGPFALAMAARARLYPVFVIRSGRRRYRLQTCAPITIERRSRERDTDLAVAVQQWTQQLEAIVREHWYQWFAFEPFYDEGAA